MRFQKRFWVCLIGLLVVGCSSGSKKNKAPKARKVENDYSVLARKTDDKLLLSDYGFFVGNMSDLTPAERVFPYAINAPLFSNYAKKARFVYLPTGTQMHFAADGAFDFDDGAILIKNFFYDNTIAKPQNQKKLIETRLLIKEKDRWKPLNYLWNENQTEATLDYVGKTTAVRWVDQYGDTKTVDYVVPNNNQCKNCHNVNNKITPIGLTAAQLNQRYFALKKSINQLDFFKSENLLTHFTMASEHTPMPAWDNALSGSINQRGRSYLYANCAHCHSSVGSAKNSGLYLDYHQNNARKRGVLKPPIAAGKGSGDLQYDIVPGYPEKSIIIYRMMSNDPAIRMPEIGRSIVHQEGVDLLKSYIEDLARE